MEASTGGWWSRTLWLNAGRFNVIDKSIRVVWRDGYGHAEEMSTLGPQSPTWSSGDTDASGAISPMRRQCAVSRFGGVYNGRGTRDRARPFEYTVRQTAESLFGTASSEEESCVIWLGSWQERCCF